MTTNLLSLISDLGPNADLLVYSDQWLEAQRSLLAGELANIAEQLDNVLKARHIKTQLQQQNLVAVQNLERDGDGQLTDVSIKIMPLPDAIKSLGAETDALDGANTVAQVCGWLADGYDITASANLRQSA